MGRRGVPCARTRSSRRSPAKSWRSLSAACETHPTRSVQPGLFPPAAGGECALPRLYALRDELALRSSVRHCGGTLPVSAFALMAPQLNPQIVTVTAAPVAAIYHVDRRVSLEELEQRLSSGPVIKQRSLISMRGSEHPLQPPSWSDRIATTALKHGYSVMWATMPETR